MNKYFLTSPKDSLYFESFKNCQEKLGKFTIPTKVSLIFTFHNIENRIINSKMKCILIWQLLKFKYLDNSKDMVLSRRWKESCRWRNITFQFVHVIYHFLIYKNFSALKQIFNIAYHIEYSWWWIEDDSWSLLFKTF